MDAGGRDLFISRQASSDYGSMGCKAGQETKAMFDVLMLALLAGAFAGAVGYVRACASLTRPTGATPGQVR
jgi:hypothetical protein